jgi:hypothetical protein
MTRLALAIVLLTGCAPTLPETTYHPTHSDRDKAEAIRAVWAESDALPDPHTDRCDEALLYLRVAVVDDEGIRKHCGRCPPGHCPGYRASEACPWGCAAACYRRMGDWRVIVHHESVGPEPSVHEVLHLLEDCTGMGADRQHERDAVWGDVGVLKQAKQGLRDGG